VGGITSSRTMPTKAKLDHSMDKSTSKDSKVSPTPASFRILITPEGFRSEWRNWKSPNLFPLIVIRWENKLI